MFIVVLMVVFGIVVAVLNILFGKSTPTRNVRNFKVRFDPVTEKYYIVNQLATHDEPVTNCFGRRIFYVDKPKAEFIVQKMNS